MGINVLSLFDGMSCGQIALERAGIKVDNYFASEIDKYGQIVSKANYPNTIYLGDVRHINAKDLPKIDLIIGGSPCQSFSFAGKRKGMSTKDEQQILTLEHYLKLKSEGFEFEGQSYLFWEYMRLLNECNPKYFLLENVEMGEKWEKVLSKAIGVNGIHINSALLSAQNRKRIYWTNIGLEPGGLFGDLVSTIKQPKDKGIMLKDILEKEVGKKFFISNQRIETIMKSERHVPFISEETQKHNCLLAGYAKIPTDGQYIVASRGRNPENPKSREVGLNTEQMLEPRMDGKTNCLTTVAKDNYVTDDVTIRRLTPLECERLQTVKDNYTAVASDSQRYRMLGNGWTVDVIAHILSYGEWS